jgi:hypothetical protein
MVDHGHYAADDGHNVNPRLKPGGLGFENLGLDATS